MTRHLGLLLTALAAALVVAACGPAAAGARGGSTKVFYVSPTGDDSSSGSRAAPFRTLERARRAARGVDRRRSAVEIRLRRGVYRLRRPLQLNAGDSGTAGHEVVWRAAPGEHPVISGGVRVRGWSLFDADKHIYRARVKGLKTRQLYVNGRRAIRTRTKLNPPGFTKTSTGYTTTDPSMASWRNQSDIEVVSLVQWKSYRCAVAAIRGTAVEMRNPCWHNANLFPDDARNLRQFAIEVPSWIENAYELLDSPREWYYDRQTGWLYYIPARGEDVNKADVEAPVAQMLVEAKGTADHPIQHVRFEGLTFSNATWLGPNLAHGYVEDQTGFHIQGPRQVPNQAHSEFTFRTPGDVSLGYASQLTFKRNRFTHLGAVGLDLNLGSQHIRVVGNRFEDTSGAAIQVGGTSRLDARPARTGQRVRDNRVTNNVVTRAAQEYLSAPGIMVGYTTRTLVSHNELSDLPYTAIAVGWGWGLADPGRFPGYGGAEDDRWHKYSTPTSSHGNKILNNRIRRFLQVMWDGGAVYSLGFQGTSLKNGELIAGNVASGKGRDNGGAVFYTDGGSRYVTLRQNAAFDNPPGFATFFGIRFSYGADWGGCRPYGDITFESNYWQYPTNPPASNYDVCPFPPYPLRVHTTGDKQIRGARDVPARILDSAGLQPSFRDIR